jgi:hypothetical protein
MNEKKEQGATGSQELRKYQRKVKIPKKIAEDQVQMLLDYYDVDRDYIVEEARMPVDACILSMIKGITRGRLSVVDTDEGPIIKQYFEKPVLGNDVLTYRSAGSRVTKALKNVGDDDSRVNAVLGALSGVDPDEFGNLHHVDRNTAVATGNFFLFV